MAAITGATVKDQVQKAISAHGVYKVKLGQQVETGGSEMTASQASSDKECPTGVWLSAMDSASKASPHYATVMDLHAKFHKAAGEIVALSSARKRGEALAAMEMGSTFKQCSAKLVMALSAWGDSL